MLPARSKTGFTLVELVLVMVILGVVGTAIYGTFANGINIWKRITQQSQPEDINLFFDRIAFDLRNSFKLTGIKFDGMPARVSFPVRSKFTDGQEIKDQIGRVIYSFDRRKKAVERIEANYSDVFYKREGKERVLVEDVLSLKFEYFTFDQKTKEYTWTKNWQEEDDPFGIVTEENLPLIVKVELSIRDEDQDRQYVRTVPIPSGCCWPVEGEVR